MPTAAPPSVAEDARIVISGSSALRHPHRRSYRGVRGRAVPRCHRVAQTLGRRRRFAPRTRRTIVTVAGGTAIYVRVLTAEPLTRGLDSHRSLDRVGSDRGWSPEAERPPATLAKAPAHTALARLVGARRATILEALQTPKTTPEAAQASGIAASTASAHLHELTLARVLERRRSGRFVYYVLSETGKRLVDELGTTSRGCGS
jgi:hypothetical protein